MFQLRLVGVAPGPVGPYFATYCARFFATTPNEIKQIQHHTNASQQIQNQITHFSEIWFVTTYMDGNHMRYHLYCYAQASKSFQCRRICSHLEPGHSCLLPIVSLVCICDIYSIFIEKVVYLLLCTVFYIDSHFDMAASLSFMISKTIPTRCFCKPS